jgi:hypothetical protein
LSYTHAVKSILMLAAILAGAVSARAQPGEPIR